MIEIGEYIRTKKGEIMKVASIPVEVDGKVTYQTDKGWVELECDIVKLGRDIKVYQTDINCTILETAIKSHSKNIIDLIEEGDLIRYQLKDIGNFKDIGTIRMLIDEEDGGENVIATGVLGNRVLENVKILSILTHEQYEQNCYRLEE